MIQIEAMVRQAVSAAERREAASLTEAFPYIPGWVVRGGLAAAWIREFGEPKRGTELRARFVDLFEGAVRFGALMPQGDRSERSRFR